MKEKPVVAVTGGAGYIGSHTVIALYEAGYTPVIIDDFRTSSKDVPERIAQITRTPIKVLDLDVSDGKSLAEVLRPLHCRAIIHFAAYKAVSESIANPQKYFSNNIGAMLGALHAATECGINHFVFSSSCTVYGAPTVIPVTEETPLSFITPYGFTKLAGENVLQQLSETHPEFRTVSLRYFNPVGGHPSGLLGDDPTGGTNNLIPLLTRSAAGRSGRIKIFGSDYPTPDGTCIRDYIHVMDVAQAHVAALRYLEEATHPGQRAFNIGLGEGMSVKALIELFNEVNELNIPYETAGRREGDIPSIYADTEKARRDLKWQPIHTIREALRSAWQYEKNRSNITKP